MFSDNANVGIGSAAVAVVAIIDCGGGRGVAATRGKSLWKSEGILNYGKKYGGLKISSVNNELTIRNLCDGQTELWQKLWQKLSKNYTNILIEDTIFLKILVFGFYSFNPFFLISLCHRRLVFLHVQFQSVRESTSKSCSDTCNLVVEHLSVK